MVINKKNPKRVFWEALLITLVVFVGGIVFGVAMEGKRVDNINEYYLKSEISMVDMLALNSFIGDDDLSCSDLVSSNFEFADRIYEEALLLEKYESSGRVTETMKLEHTKYDLLRTFLWDNAIASKEKCNADFSVIIYLYNSEPEDLTEKATNAVWSKILLDVKNSHGGDVVLIPIAADSNLVSLNSKLSNFNITSFPAVVINDKDVLTALESADDLAKYLG
jgi:hypothetical protein